MAARARTRILNLLFAVIFGLPRPERRSPSDPHGTAAPRQRPETVGPFASVGQAVLGTAVLATLRRAARKAAFEAPVVFEPSA